MSSEPVVATGAPLPEPMGDEQSWGSPLWMVADQPVLNTLVAELREDRDRIAAAVGGDVELRFSHERLRAARDAFASMIRRGEEQLHRLCELLCNHLLGSYELRSVVIGEVERTRERFSFALDIDSEQLYATTDLDLGRRQVERLRMVAPDGGWLRAELVSNVVEYLAHEQNRFQIYRVLSRIKAEEEIWAKVCDEIFDFDTLVLRDKQLRHLSRYVKDVFGVKIVVDSADAAYKVQSYLATLEFSVDELRSKSLEPGEDNGTLQFVEVKDYLSRRSRKQSGFAALKSVVRWNSRTFELQVQPLHNWMVERELLTRESHRAFKATREQVRRNVVERQPLFGFYLHLLRWLFLDPQGAPPTYPGVRIVLDP